MSQREQAEGSSIFIGTLMRKLLILPRTGLGGREECPRQKVASDGLLKYIRLPGKVYSSDMMIGP